MVDFVEICNVCARKVIIVAAKRIINSDKVCRSYSDLNFGVTFFGTQCNCLLNLQLEAIMHRCVSECGEWEVCQIDECTCAAVYRLSYACKHAPHISTLIGCAFKHSAL